LIQRVDDPAWLDYGTPDLKPASVHVAALGVAKQLLRPITKVDLHGRQSMHAVIQSPVLEGRHGALVTARPSQRALFRSVGESVYVSLAVQAPQQNACAGEEVTGADLCAGDQSVLISQNAMTAVLKCKGSSVEGYGYSHGQIEAALRARIATGLFQRHAREGDGSVAAGAGVTQGSMVTSAGDLERQSTGDRQWTPLTQAA
jgi:hypothetical protein